MRGLALTLATWETATIPEKLDNLWISLHGIQETSMAPTTKKQPAKVCMKDPKNVLQPANNEKKKEELSEIDWVAPEPIVTQNLLRLKKARRIISPNLKIR